MSSAQTQNAAQAKASAFAREYPFTSRHLDLDGVRYHYVDEGPRDGEPILFVHGNPTWSFYWRHAIARFSDRFRCIAVDHVGCGFSDKPAKYDYRLAQHVSNLERLAQHLQLERITLALHDWGGPIGLGFAARQPQRIARLLLLNTSAFTGMRAPWRIRICRAPGLGALAVRGLNAFAVAATVMALERRERMTPTVRRGYLAPYDSFANRIATLRFVQDIPLSPAHPSWAELARILLPLSSIQEELQLGTLRTLDIKTLQSSVPVVVIYRQNDYLSQAVQSLLQLFAGQASTEKSEPTAGAE
jgi:haloalkane dehalogenase